MQDEEEGDGRAGYGAVLSQKSASYFLLEIVIRVDGCFEQAGVRHFLPTLRDKCTLLPT